MFGRKQPKEQKKVVHETLAVKHKRGSESCKVWLICSCGKDHAYGNEPKSDDSGDHNMRLIDAA